MAVEPSIVDRAAVDHARAAAAFLADESRARQHDATVWGVRKRRDRAVAAVAEWEALRDLASEIKEHTLARLGGYLAQFERHATAHGVRMHWARDAGEHNAIVLGILSGCGARRVVKSKSMLTEECGLNAFLAARGIDVVDTDLGERIVQLRGERPSHIVMPAIHLQVEDIGETFRTHLGTSEQCLEPEELVAAARADLRERFLAADAAITGVNFAVAETGAIVICTNEGNADLGMALAPVHIASMGIEKIIPRMDDLAVFLRLLARSGTGQAITTYTSHVWGAAPGREMHVVLVDNGRSTQLRREGFWRSLKCIRCGACMNTCPVYRRSGGHSYGSTVPGPIGAVLTPGIDLERYAALPFASTLCGSCAAVCPVKIDLDAQLLRWRQQIVDAGYVSLTKSVAMGTASRVLSWPRVFRAAGAVVRWAAQTLPQRVVRAAAGRWVQGRAVPELPRKSFWGEQHRADRKP